MTDRKVKKPGQEETDPIQTSGFFPQSRAAVHDKAKMDELIEQAGKTAEFAQYRVFQELGNYPEAADFLIGRLPQANIDGTLFIVKALAQIGDPKAIDPLLAKWNRGVGGSENGVANGAPRGAPGTRYIPDALAEISARTGKVDPRIVPALVRSLPQMRFDYCFHVAHALGEVGRAAPPDSDSRKLAERWLKDLADTHWFKPVREEAQAALKKL
jgi:hypothetical protein